MLAGRRALITGATMGFGQAVAEAFLAAGADVSFCARDLKAVEAERARLATAYPRRIVHAFAADVAVPRDVERFVAASAERLGGIDVVIANAGIQGPKGPVDRNDWQEWAQTIAVNLLGTVYLTRCALEHLRRSPQRAKIVMLSGGGATKARPFMSAYAVSKAGLVRYGETLAEEVRAQGIDVNTIAPGALNTRMLDEVLAAGADAVGEAAYREALAQAESGGSPLDAGARLCVFLASAASDGITGKLIAAQWDPWERFAAECERLNGDVYTLRRIVPEERGWSW